MGIDIGFSQGYLWLNSWVLANIIQLATQDFCEKHLTYQVDPSRRLFDQMVLAARCIPANIAEGTSRKSTSVETEMRLVDVARASNDELFGRKASPDAPKCPVCGAPMIKRMIRKGSKQGQEFWGCSNWPKCNGSRQITLQSNDKP